MDEIKLFESPKADMKYEVFQKLVWVRGVKPKLPNFLSASLIRKIAMIAATQVTVGNINSALVRQYVKIEPQTGPVIFDRPIYMLQKKLQAERNEHLT